MVLSDFITLKEAKTAKKGDFIGVVIRQSDLSSGSKNGKDWSKKVFTVQDATGEIALTAWNDEISLLTVGGLYEFKNCWWKEHEGKVGLGIGQYAKIKKIDDDRAKNYNIKTDKEITPEPQGPGSVNGEGLPETPENLIDLTKNETITLLQIEKVILDTMKRIEGNTHEPNPQKVGLFIKEIYRKSKQPNFRKANDKE